MLFVETPLFTRQIADAMDAEEYRAFQTMLAERPDAGALLRRGGGLRKVRWAVGGRGKSAGVRVIYYWATAAGRIHLVYVYPKNVQADLTDAQLRVLRTIIEDE